MTIPETIKWPALDTRPFSYQHVLLVPMTASHPAENMTSSDEDSDLSDDAETPGSPPTILPKGAACIACRNRKKVFVVLSKPSAASDTLWHSQPCDGNRPLCTPCKRMKRECVYREPTHKTRNKTKNLLDRIKVLENKLASLTAVHLYAPRPSGSSNADRLDGLLSGWC